MQNQVGKVVFFVLKKYAQNKCLFILYGILRNKKINGFVIWQ